MTFGDHGVDFLLSPGAHETSISLIKEVQKSDIRMILHNGDISYAMGYVSISHIFKIPFTVLHKKLYLLLVKTQGSSIFTNDNACYVTCTIDQNIQFLNFLYCLNWDISERCSGALDSYNEIENTKKGQVLVSGSEFYY